MTPPSAPTVASVAVTAPRTTLQSGETIQLTVTVLSSDGTLLTGRELTWASTQPAVASVTTTGLVTAMAVRGGSAASATITASTAGKTGSVLLAVSPVPVAVVELTPAAPTVRLGQTLALTATLRDVVGEPVSGRPVGWSSLAPSVATVSSQGVVTGVAPGTAEIRATAEGVSGSVVVTVPPVPAVTLMVTAAPAYPVVGDTITMAWTSTAAASCVASGAWTGPKALQGTEPIVLGMPGSRTFRLTCSGPGGDTSAETSLLVRLPVLPTSYANFNENGVYPTWLPRFNDATAYADFAGTGELALFTAPMRYDPGRPIEEAGPGLFEFWRMAPDQVSWLPLTVPVIQEAPNCMHPRKTLITDVNGDRRPDLYVLCHGYDALPYPGEPSVVLVSQPDGSYRQRRLSNRIGFYHGGATCDLDDDGRPELISADGAGIKLWQLAPDGTGTIDEAHPVSQFSGHYYTAECLDVDLDGRLDLIIGGHEPTGWPGEPPTEVVFSAGTGTPIRRVIPTVAGYEIVLDFVVTGAAAGRTLWVLRTSRYPGYVDSYLQRVDLSNLTSTMAKQGPTWFPWLIPYVRNGAHYLGTNALGRGWEMPYVP